MGTPLAFVGFVGVSGLLLRRAGYGMTRRIPVANYLSAVLTLHSSRTRVAQIVLASILYICAGCCPEVKGKDSGTQSGDGSTGSARLSAIQEEVFDQHCVNNCHETLNAAENLQLSELKSFKNLVNTPSQQITTINRVVPGEPDRSYLIMKLEGEPRFKIWGEQMPLNAPPRPQEEADRLRAWITRGAPND